MPGRGPGVFGEAASRVLACVAPNRVNRADPAPRMAMTKPAVQPFPDRLEDCGLLERSRDPEDARGRIVKLSDPGNSMMTEANAVKPAIGAEYRAQLAEDHFAALRAALTDIAGRKP